MSERPGAVTMKGAPLTLVGEQVKVGDPAPDFTAVGTDLSTEGLSSYRGKTLVLLSVPSLDTSVCDKEVRRFNKAATELSNDVRVVAISMDLPFAQKRWCGAAEVENVETLSDHRDASFGQAYGVLIKELRLLARSVWIVDRDGKIAYSQLVKEVTDEPDYDEVLENVRNLA